jgi:hypothetical protein
MIINFTGAFNFSGARYVVEFPDRINDSAILHTFNCEYDSSVEYAVKFTQKRPHNTIQTDWLIAYGDNNSQFFSYQS